MNSQRISDTTVPAIDLEDLTNIGEDCGQGNLLGIQPYMTPWDYASPEAFYGKLDGYMSVAANQGWLNRKTIAIFPEYIGTWLVALDMDEAVYNASTLAAGMRGALLRTAPRLLITLPRAKGRDRVRDAIFRMKAERISAVFENTFSRLARLYGSTIVAGSLVLPEPVVREGHLLSGAGPLQNVSAVFRPDGSLHRELVRKVHVVADEAPFTGAGAARALPVYDTPAGRLAVLICADSWYPACYEALSEKQPDLFAVPNNESPPWDAPWGGYNPGPQPPDVRDEDVGRLANHQAWVKYALPGRMGATPARAGMHAFFHGQMWDMKGYGQSIVVTKNEIHLAKYVERAALVNYWIGR